MWQVLLVAFIRLARSEKGFCSIVVWCEGTVHFCRQYLDQKAPQRPSTAASPLRATGAEESGNFALEGQPTARHGERRGQHRKVAAIADSEMSESELSGIALEGQPTARQGERRGQHRKAAEATGHSEMSESELSKVINVPGEL
jgi:hypothetical protein